MDSINTQTSMQPSGSWLVTGASSGIGAEIAVLLRNKAKRLILVGRNEERLQETAQRCGGENGLYIEIIVQDLSFEGAGNDLAHLITDRNEVLAGMVLAAGATERATVAQASPESIQQQIHLNSLEHGELLHQLAKPMVAMGTGKILLVASMAGFFGIPGQGAYAASKAWLVSLGCALHHELRSQGVDLTTLCPGATRTRFFDRSGISLNEGWAKKANWQTPEEVALFAMKALEQRRMIAVPHWRNRAILTCMRLLSRTVIIAAVAKELRKQ